MSDVNPRILSRLNGYIIAGRHALLFRKRTHDDNDDVDDDDDDANVCVTTVAQVCALKYHEETDVTTVRGKERIYIRWRNVQRSVYCVLLCTPIVRKCAL